MNRNLMIGLLALVFVAVGAAGGALFTVDQRQQAVVLRLGRPDHTINAPGQDDAGLQVKIPLADTVVRFDRQNQAVEADGQDMRAADQQHLLVDATLRYRIVDPVAYLRALGDDDSAQARLTPLIAGALRERIGALKASDVITGGREAVAAAALGDIAARVKAAKMGLQLIDLSLRRVGLSTADQAAVYERMKAARQQEAAQIKAQGEMDVAAVKAAGDKAAAVILADGRTEAGKIMGDGDAKRAALFADAYGRDPQFADFYRTMAAYEKTMESGDTTVLLSSDNGFLKYFKSGPGK